MYLLYACFWLGIRILTNKRTILTKKYANGTGVKAWATSETGHVPKTGAASPTPVAKYNIGQKSEFVKVLL